MRLVAQAVDHQAQYFNAHSLHADTLRRFTFKKAKWSTVDVDGAAKAKPELGGRFRFISALQNLEDSRKIQIKASQVMNRYRIYKMPDDVDELAGTLYRMALDRETKEIDRLHKVISWATSPGCLATKLAAHFGDALPEGKDTCGHCSACATDGQGLDAPGMSEEAALGRLEIFDHTKWNKVLAEGSVPRDDARLLARFALGFTSPRMTALKLSKHPVSGEHGHGDEEIFSLSTDAALWVDG